MHKTRYALGLAVVLLASPLVAARAQEAPELTMQLQATKGFQFSWTPVPDATHYVLLEDSTGSSGFTPFGSKVIPATSTSFEHIVPLYQRVNARYIVSACNSARCTDSNTVHASAPLTEAIGYFKAANVNGGDVFGSAVALSADGTTLAIGAKGEDSAATGIDGDPTDNSAPAAGAVYVFVRSGSGSAWVQQAYIKASNTERSDLFGAQLALSADGSTLAVAAHAENSNAAGLDGNQLDNSAPDAGAVYVYARLNSAWTQQAYIKASNTDANDAFGFAVSLSSDGRTLAIGAPLEDSVATGVNGNQANNSARDSGAVYVWSRSGGAWSQQAYIKASNTGTIDFFGTAIDLSNDGSTLAVGASDEDSRATGVNGVQSDNSVFNSGAVYVYVRVGSVWTQQAYIKASNTSRTDYFGTAVALSGDGAALAVGAEYEDSGAVGVNGNQSDESAQDAGAVYLYARAGTSWTQQTYIKASNTGAGDRFGHAIALSNDGATLAVGATAKFGGGAFGESSAAVGINGDETSDAIVGSGAAYVFAKNNGLWTQRAYVKASNTMPTAGFTAAFGSSLALAGNGGTLAVGAPGEDGNSSGINGPQVTPPLLDAGAVYVY
jgi:trimeric autotransporter adhesin